jgi:signal transduction histidine kinase
MPWSARAQPGNPVAFRNRNEDIFQDFTVLNELRPPVGSKLRYSWSGLQSAWILSLVLIVGLVGHFAVQRITTWHVTADVLNNAQATSAFLTASFERTADAVETIIDGTIANLEAAPDVAVAQDYLERRALPAAVVQLTLVGADGWSLASSQGQTTPVDLNDRPHIRVHADGLLGPDEMFVSVPVLGRISGRWTIQFTKALRGPQGAFEGVLVASYAVDDFIGLYSTFPMQDGFLIALTGLDGVIRALSVKGGEDAFGITAPLPDLHEVILRGGSQGVAFVSPIDGVYRVGWAQVLDGHKLYLLVAEPLEARMGVLWVYQSAWWLLMSVIAGAGYATRQYYVNAMLRERLASGRKAVEMANLTALGEIAAGLSHEISTPANTILLAIGNLKHSIATDQATKKSMAAKLDRIEASATRIKALMETVRGHARRPSGAETCDPAAAIRNALSLVGQQLRMAGIEAVSRIETCGAVALASSELETVLINLLMNARDAIRTHNPQSKRIVIVCAKDGDVVRIAVEDTGGGVPKAIREKIFEPFFTTKKHGEGTGIGLSTSLDIIRSAGGLIDVENTVEGARFTLSIPMTPTAHGASDVTVVDAGDAKADPAPIVHERPAQADAKSDSTAEPQRTLQGSSESET